MEDLDVFDVDDVLEEIKSDASSRIYIDFPEPRRLEIRSASQYCTQ